MYRIGWSLLALPIVVIALAVAYSALSAPPGGATEAILNLRYQALWYALVTYIAIGTLAAPLLLLAWRMRWLTLWHSALAGAIVGAVAFLPILAPTLFDGKLHLAYRLEQLASLQALVGIGAVHGLLFWFLALRGNRAIANRPAPSTSSHESKSAA